MKILRFLFLPILLMNFIGCNISENSNPEYTAYKGATLFDGTGNEIENSIIVIKDGRIEAVGDENTTIPENSEITDVEDKYITPGLIDAHVHLSATGLADTRAFVIKAELVDSLNYLAAKAYTKNNVGKYYEAYLRSGITGVYDTGGSPWTITLQESAENDLNAPHVAAAGPLITPAPESFTSSINPPVEKEMINLSSDSLGRKVVQYNTYLGSTGIKVWGMAPDDKAFMKNIGAVVQETQELGNKLIVHATSLKEAKAALEVGAKVLVHSVFDELVDDEFIKLIKEEEAIYTPTIAGGFTQQFMMALIGEEVEIDDPNHLIDDRTQKMFMEPERYITQFDTSAVEEFVNISKNEREEKANSVSLANLKKLHDAGVTIVVGTDAGGGVGTLHGINIYEEMEKMQEAGIPPSDLIIMATRNGAMAMERIDDIGTLEKGKMADLIILEKDPSEDISNMRSITHVMRGGLLRPVDEKFD